MPKCSAERREDGTSKVMYTPTEVGHYSIVVELGNQHIEGAPSVCEYLLHFTDLLCHMCEAINQIVNENNLSISKLPNNDRNYIP